MYVGENEPGDGRRLGDGVGVHVRLGDLVGLPERVRPRVTEKVKVSQQLTVIDRVPEGENDGDGADEAVGVRVAVPVPDDERRGEAVAVSECGVGVPVPVMEGRVGVSLGGEWVSEGVAVRLGSVAVSVHEVGVSVPGVPVRLWVRVALPVGARVTLAEKVCETVSLAVRPVGVPVGEAVSVERLEVSVGEGV